MEGSRRDPSSNDRERPGMIGNRVLTNLAGLASQVFPFGLTYTEHAQQHYPP